MCIFAIPFLYSIVEYAGQGEVTLIGLLVITGLFINGPYVLITTAVSSDLSTRSNLVGNTHALATVVAVTTPWPPLWPSTMGWARSAQHSVCWARDCCRNMAGTESSTSSLPPSF
ncbi:hypothetical protein BV898_07919 [Hypsibius exemplaris]|uniref:Major facilitator superfamily (MFS) profile domain-containing protein n=1 Tax=Hypsibius exemplaris TaxID=2072580 RepID=A0A1W0WS05_HYPEX|nr:hypothetical protein BV898_07919 [Hypsibius exemplaris]